MPLGSECGWADGSVQIASEILFLNMREGNRYTEPKPQGRIWKSHRFCFCLPLSGLRLSSRFTLMWVAASVHLKIRLLFSPSWALPELYPCSLERA